MDSILATFVRTAGEFLHAEIDVGGQRLVVLDQIDGSHRQPGDVLPVEFTALVDDVLDPSSIWAANPTRRKALIRRRLWSHQAFGQVLPLDPVLCDAGIIRIKDLIPEQSQPWPGAYFAINIARLTAWDCR